MTRSERARYEAALRERERYRLWLKFIVWRCRGMAVGCASQALNSDALPPVLPGPLRRKV